MAPLADLYARIRPEMSGFKAEAEKGIAGAKLGQLGETHGKAFGDSFGSGLTAQLRRLGPGLAAALGGLGLFEIIKKTVGGASDLNETISKSNVVFGQFAGAVQKAFADAPRTIGQTTQAADEAAATLGNLFVSMQIGQPQAAKMSVTMVKLASDLASFNNASPEDAMEALRSGLIGETEPLRKFGVNLNDAALKAEALRLGLGPIGPTLTALQRTQAAYSLILQQTTTAQGDFARTSTGAANQQRILVAQLEQTATSVGRLVLPAYQGVLTAVNAIGPGTLVAAGAVAVLSNRLAASGAAASVFGDLKAAHSLYVEQVATGAPRFATAMQVMSTATGKLKAAGSSIVGLFGGPWGLALTGATIGAGLFFQALADGKQKVAQLADALEGLLTQYAKSNSLNDVTIAGMLKHDKALADVVLHTDEYGVSVQQLLAAANGVPGSLEEIEKAEWKLRIAQGGLTGDQDRAFNAMKALAEQGKSNVDIDKALAQAQGGLTVSTKELTLQQSLLKDITDNVNDKITTSAQLADALKSAYDRLYGAGIGVNEATEHLAATQDTLKTAVDAAVASHDRNAHSLDMNTAAGRTNRDNLEALIQSTNDMYLAEITAGVGVAEATRRHETRIDAVRREAGQVSFNKDETEKLITTYGRVPTQVQTDVKTTGVEAVLRQMEDLYIAQRVLAEGLSVAEATRIYATHGQSANEIFRGHAEGGPIVGPGTGTSDSVMARLSAGEHVITAAEVKAAGGHQVIEAIRKLFLRGRSPQVRMPGDGSEGLAFAAGGPVWPYPVTQSHIKLMTLAQIMAKFGGGDGSWTGPISANVANAMGFIKAQAGKPYIWASAGPNGYDCSGLLSAAWNVLHGKYPYSHTFSTMNEASYFPLAGSGLFTAGWANAGERGGGSVGHTAGRLAGLSFESTGSRGVHITGVTPLSNFAHIGHYDRGGAWPSGTLGVNTSGRTEQVTPASTMDAVVDRLDRLIAAVERVAPGVGREIGAVGRGLVQTARAV